MAFKKHAMLVNTIRCVCRPWDRDASGQPIRPWCPEARLAEHQEQEQLNKEAEARKQASQSQVLFSTSKKAEYRHSFPDLPAVSTLDNFQV